MNLQCHIKNKCRQFAFSIFSTLFYFILTKNDVYYRDQNFTKFYMSMVVEDYKQKNLSLKSYSVITVSLAYYN